MAVQAQFGGWLPSGGIPGFAEEQLRAPPLTDYDARLSAAAANTNGYRHCPAAVVVSGGGAQSELTCNGSSGGVVLPSSRKRGRDDAGHFDQHVSSPSAAGLMPFPAATTQKARRGGVDTCTAAAASISGRAAVDALVLAELCRHGAEVDALVRAECESMRAGLERERKRQRQELARVVVGAAARKLREKEAELVAARRRTAQLEERIRQAAAESHAWQGLARGHEAVAAELRAALDHVVLRGAAAAAPAEEGFGESDGGVSLAAVADDDAQSCCFVSKDAPADAKWGCKACGEGEATVLLLPCRHLCLCKACEPRTDACPACLAVKNASIHVAPN